ncbi:MAG: hypothetical protein KJI69_00100 [Patescibacteria group bacterium]|nr:hypothetical protein [Patescibacteria group bacterium]
MDDKFVDLVQAAAEARGESPVPRKCIVDALDIIERKEADVERYPGGVPSLMDVFTLATQLHQESA